VLRAAAVATEVFVRGVGVGHANILHITRRQMKTAHAAVVVTRLLVFVAVFAALFSRHGFPPSASLYRVQSHE
jgi:hypothetical protein